MRRSEPPISGRTLQQTSGAADRGERGEAAGVVRALAGLRFERVPRQHHAKLSGQLLDIDVLVDDALCVEQIVSA